MFWRKEDGGKAEPPKVKRFKNERELTRMEPMGITPESSKKGKTNEKLGRA
jgi:hypothetical protein